MNKLNIQFRSTLTLLAILLCAVLVAITCSEEKTNKLVHHDNLDEAMAATTGDQLLVIDFWSPT